MSTETRSNTTETGRTTDANTAIIWMMLAVFGVGTVEYLVAGVLPDISSDIGVSNSTAGLLITIYAATVVIGGPLLTIATTRIPRTPLIIALMPCSSPATAVPHSHPTSRPW